MTSEENDPLDAGHEWCTLASPDEEVYDFSPIYLGVERYDLATIQWRCLAGGYIEISASIQSDGTRPDHCIYNNIGLKDRFEDNLLAREVNVRDFTILRFRLSTGRHTLAVWLGTTERSKMEQRWLREIARAEALERRLRAREMELERIRNNFYRDRVEQAVKHE